MLLLQVERRRKEHFEVETPYLAALVKGTRFSVSVAGTGAAVHVTDGMVEVSAPAADRPVLVHPGQTAMVDSGALDTIRLDGGRSQNTRPESHAQTGEKRAIRRAIGDTSIDVGAATNGLVSSTTLAATGSLATDQIAATGEMGADTVTNGSLTSRVGGASETAGGAIGGAVGGAVGGVGGAVGGTVGDVGGAVGGAVGGVGGAVGGAIQNTTSTVANTTSNLGGGLGNLLQGF